MSDIGRHGVKNRLKAAGIGHRFGNHVLFRGLSLNLQSGDMIAVTGANGSGKSTLLKILAGMMRSTAGNITLSINGVLLQQEEYPHYVSYVAPHLNLYDDLTAQENLGLIARLCRLPDAPERIRNALDTVQLTARSVQCVRTYSSGMKQRLKIAAAIMEMRPLLLLDEPTTNLDDRGKRMYADLIRGAQASGSIIVVASNVPEDFHLAETVLCVEDYAP